MAQEEVQNNNGNNNKNGTTTKTVTFKSFKPQIIVEAQKANEAVNFYKTVFGAEEINRVLHPKRKADQETPLILSVDLNIAGSLFSVSDLTDDLEKKEGSGIVFNLETEDIKGAINTAVSNGAVTLGEVIEDEISGHVAKVKDPFGFVWVFSSPSIKNTADVEA